METFVMLLVIATLVFGAGAVSGAEYQDRITEGRRRRLAAQRREVNEAVRQLSASTATGHQVTGWGQVIEVPFPDQDGLPAPVGRRAGRPVRRQL